VAAHGSGARLDTSDTGATKNGYQPSDGLRYKQMLNDPQTHPEHKHVVEIAVPIQPL
jgi:hypothetical protein